MPRSAGYSQEEDKFLCQVYMEISQDPITGVYQSSDQFWSRVVEAYGSGKNENWIERSKKSIISRVQTIERATKKMHACIKQCENKRPSGASNEDIFNQAKLMLREDSKFQTGWKFDHVWNIIKNFEKFKDGAVPTKRISIPHAKYTSLENPTIDSPTQTSSGLSSFSLNLTDDETIGGSPSPRPCGIKKSKMKRKLVEETTSVVNTFEEGNRQLVEQLKKTSAQRQYLLEIQNKNHALKERMAEDKFLFYDMTSVTNPNIRAYIEDEQERIIQTRKAQQQKQQVPPPSTSFEQYMNDFGGSGSGLPDY